MNQIESTDQFIQMSLQELNILEGEMYVTTYAFLHHYLFNILRIPVNNSNLRLYNSLKNYTNTNYILEDMESLLITLDRNIIQRIYNFISYMLNNRRNPNLYFMIMSYNY